MNSLYIHIPFCKSRCIYCDFFSSTCTERTDDYVGALRREIEERCAGEEFDTIYIGGGTPSWIGAGRIKEILESIGNCKNSKETTIECNPDDITEEFAENIKTLPINRVSVGIQSLNDERLRLIGRRHSAQQAIEAIGRLQKAGFGNISTDLIYGLPGQTLEEWKHDLDTALRLGTQHVSAYSLMYEEGTALWRMREEHRVSEAHEELSISMYEYLTDACGKAGLQQYELSNFALPGYESRHNSAYWEGTAYIGVGAGAHSFDGEYRRRMNVCDIDAYIQSGRYTEEVLNDNERFDELVFTALRTRRGIDWCGLEHRYPTLAAEAKKIADRHVAMGNLVWEDGRLRLTRQALFVSDDVMSDLMSGVN